MKTFFCLLILICVGGISHAQLPQLSLVQVATGFTSPIDIKNCGDDRIFVVERAGQIKIMSKSGVVRATPFLDIRTRVLSGGEQGLLSLAFSPNYKQDGYFYVNYTNGTGSGSTRISRFQVSPTDSNIALPASEKILLTFTQPYTNHNGASLMFGGDGYLYDSQGDGGSSGDPQSYAQNRNSLLGKILRLNVSNPDTTYTIPSSNPFVGVPNTRAEIWSYGLRNPWRCSFDRITKDLWMADVGQGLWEEVNFSPVASAGGENFGWRCYEGFSTYNTSGCPGSGFTPPVYAYSHAYGGCSVTGGYVYRGTQHSKLWGLYLFTDFCSGKFWSIKRTGLNSFDPDSLQTFLTNQYSTFGEDNLGELYVAGLSNGRIYRITETSDCNPVAFISLSDTVSGCKPVNLTALYGDSLSYQWYDGNGIILNAAVPSYEVMESGWYKVKVSKAQSGCEAFSDSVYVYAYDSTELIIQDTLIKLCFYDQPISLTDNIFPAGGRFLGNGVANDTFYNHYSLLGENVIEYHYVNNYGCPAQASFKVQVNDTATLQIMVNDSSVCVNQDTFNLVSFVLPSGGIYSGTGITESPLFFPANAGIGTANINYNYLSSAGCVSDIDLSLTVLAQPELIKNIPSSYYCIDDPDFSMSTFILPAGGVFSGTGVVNDTFSPLTSGVGEFLIDYIYTDEFGCSAMDTFTISVNICTDIDPVRGDYIKLKVSPNPNKGIFDIALTNEVGTDVELTISDITGKIILRTGNKNEWRAINLLECSKGVYLVQLRTNREMLISKILIQ